MWGCEQSGVAGLCSGIGIRVTPALVALSLSKAGSKVQANRSSSVSIIDGGDWYPRVRVTNGYIVVVEDIVKARVRGNQ